MPDYPLLEMLLAAANGKYPPADGGYSLLPPMRNLTSVVAFTAHAVISANTARDKLDALGTDGYGGALHPRVLLHLAGETGEIHANDVLLFARGTEGPTKLSERTDLEWHPRVKLARQIRDDVRVFGDERGFVTLGRGLAGRLELGIELQEESLGKGRGRTLLADSLNLVAENEIVFAAVSPGNARSLRAFLAAGFQPIASEVIISHPEGLTRNTT
jgi:hypothetical protein